MPDKLPIIGRDYMLIDKLARKIRQAVNFEHPCTSLDNTVNMRGRRFDVKLDDGRIARVIVELDRVEND